MGDPLLVGPVQRVRNLDGNLERLLRGSAPSFSSRWASVSPS